MEITTSWKQEGKPEITNGNQEFKQFPARGVS